MDNQLRLAMLGKLHIEQGGQPLLGLTSVKGQALLTYLAVTRQPHSRSALTGLLWAEMTEEAARANLRVVLSQLRRAVGDVLTVTRRTVEFDSQGAAWLDVAVLEDAANSGANLHAAAALYRGDFLDDFHVPEVLAFEEWLLVERERYRQLGLNVLERLADEALRQGRFGQGIEAARRLLSLEPWSEDGHQQLMRLLAASGQRSAALAQFEACRRLLAEELGVAPAATTAALYEAIRAGEWDQLPPPSTESATVGSSANLSLPAHNLPAATTSFVGRQAERRHLAGLLAEAECRLITITGPGGVGKTRLALTIAAEQIKPGTLFGDGIYFVPLASVRPVNSATASAANPLVLAIGAALELSFSGNSSPTTQLLNALRGQELLLLLDNFEHLSDDAGLVVDMLEQTPGLKVIVTSRQSLHLFEEWLFDLGGLAYPAPNDDTGLETFDSIQLFEQRARQASSIFDLAAELPYVVDICRLLAGLPLGIELAAAWVRTLPCRQIVREIEQNLDFLATSARNVPERQRSLRAVFDYSWQFSSGRRAMFLQAVVRFLPAALPWRQPNRWPGATAQTLADLADHSLVRQAGSGRYDLHEQLRQYGLEKLAADQG